MRFMSLAAGFIGYTMPLLITIRMLMQECFAYTLVQIHLAYVCHLCFNFSARSA